MLRIEKVVPPACAELASRILCEAWPPTTLHYTPAYLAWQLGFPGTLSVPQVAAFDGDEAVGFAGATMRRVRFRGVECEVVVVSFVAVRPRWQGRGIAARLYDALLDELRRLGATVLTFALEGSAGEQTLLRAYQAAGFQVRPLGVCVTHGYLARSAAMPGDFCVESYAGAEIPAAVAEACSDQGTIWAGLGREQLAHYRKDSRPREFLRLRDKGGVAVGGAWLVLSELVTATGLEKMNVVDNLYMSNPAPAALAALFTAAGQYWKDRKTGPMVLAPNLWGVDRKVLSTAGIRPGATRFAAYLCAASGAEPLLDAVGTNVEVV